MRLQVLTIRKIISGGQTGVDRAALDWAIARGLAHGGYCPIGRKAEDGPIPPKYRLTELSSDDYSVRTRKNVEVADGTLILKRGELKGGTTYTAEVAAALKKPLFVIDVDEPVDQEAFAAWTQAEKIRTLNVAGPRESQSPGIYERATDRLGQLFNSN